MIARCRIRSHAALLWCSGVAGAQPCAIEPANCQALELPFRPDRAIASAGAGHQNPQVVADHFITAASTSSTSSLCWWGTYRTPCGEEPASTLDRFVATYYARSACGTPGEIIGGPFEQGTTLLVTRRDACGEAGGSFSEYTGAHAPVALAARSCFFLEIRNILDGEALWYWARTWLATDGTSIVDADGDGYEMHDLQSFDRAFCIGAPIDIFRTLECLPPQFCRDEACPCDYNLSGGVDTQDFFAFLAAFFEGHASADFNRSGGVTSQDFFDFLICFLSPPDPC